jgi:plastocyanin
MSWLRDAARGFACLGALAGAATPSLAHEAVVSGVLSVAFERLSLADVTPAVVYLEAIEAPSVQAPRQNAEVRQRAARFSPGFLVVTVGQPIEMPNDDTIFHNVFSYSRPNDFDLGLYRSGDSRTLRFEHAGPVRLYCSIHERMNGLIFVAPTRLFAVPSPSGDFRIPNVPPGRYRLRVWSERVPGLARELTLDGDEHVRLELALGAPAS